MTLTQAIDEGLLVAKAGYWETGCGTAIVWWMRDRHLPWRWALKHPPGSGPDHGGAGSLRGALWAVAMLVP